jgi:ubiquinone/menaquinone biosynthesis C-methylase UbiE
MNENHATLCASPEWAAHVQDELLAPLTTDVSLGDRMLEIGPGPGAATEWLRRRVGRLTAVEADPDAVSRLRDTCAGTNVEVLHGDATALDFADASFDSVGTFTMLHHVPTIAAQDRVLAEAFRVLRPGGVFIGADSLPSTGLHEFHAGDIYNPIDPASMLARLRTVGFGRMTVSVDTALTFIAYKPGQPEPACGEAGPAS